MKENVKRMWVNALRSGQYQKCKGAMESEGKFCVTGVLADVYSRATGNPVETDHLIPVEVSEWAGLSGSQADWLMKLNDSNGGYGFRALANVIEAAL